MRINKPVTQRDIPVAAAANILSTTDRRGQISHINDEFVAISGFSRDELLGQPHNIIRHPDMPRAAYKAMWSRLQKGKSWLGAVKNRCKNGDHYWVQAYAIPITDAHGTITELQSVRSRLDEKARARAERLYRRLAQTEPSKGDFSIPALRRSPGLFTKASAAFCGLLGLHALLIWTLPGYWGAVVATAIAVLTGISVLWLLFSPWRKLVRRARFVVDDRLAQQVFSGRMDDIGSVELAMHKEAAELDAVTKRLHDVIGMLNAGADTTSALGSQAQEAVREQSEQIDSIASASEETSTTAREVSQHAAHMLDKVNKAKTKVEQGKGLATGTQQSMNSLAGELDHASQTVSRLAEASREVSEVLEVIGSITEQINLLALNASIEAARAGAAGRGFAVVADEVRNLASRTKGSTEEIEKIVSHFEKQVSDSTAAMSRCGTHARSTMDNAGRSAEMLDAIVEITEEISSLCGFTSVAAGQQESAANEISQKIAYIHTMGERATATVGGAQHALIELKENIAQVDGLVDSLRVRNLAESQNI